MIGRSWLGRLVRPRDRRLELLAAYTVVLVYIVIASVYALRGDPTKLIAAPLVLLSTLLVGFPTDLRRHQRRR